MAGYGVAGFAAGAGDGASTSYATGGGPRNKRQTYEVLRAQLENERSSFLAHWRELADYVLPRRQRFNITDRNRGEKRNQKILDNTATLAARTLKAGMMGGITSPARPWFRLGVADPVVNDMDEVQVWCAEVSTRMLGVFSKSNLYNTLPITYGDLGVFATSAFMVEEDFDQVLRCYSFPIGSYMISNNYLGRVDTFMREFSMTVRQLVEKFGKRVRGGKNDGGIDWSNFSSYVKGLWDANQRETWIDVVHVIKPNDEYDPAKIEAKFKRYTSCYYERGITTGGGNQYMGPEVEVFLRESGYDLFPVLCPRWETAGEEVYGTTCPGMEALGDIKQLQTGVKRGMQAIEKHVNPTMIGPAGLKNQRTTLVSGDTNWTDEREGQKGFRPLHEVRPDTAALEEMLDRVRARIKLSFFEPLFLDLIVSERAQPITAAEVRSRNEEKILQVGPMLEQFNQDVLDPLIDLAFDIMARQGLIPEPPDVLKGRPLKVEYISVMAQVQRLVGISAIERFAGFVGQIAQQTQDVAVLDMIDIDELIDKYAEAVGVQPSVLRADALVAQIRQARAKQRQQAETAAAIPAGARAAKDLAGADMSGDNALTRLLQTARAGQLAPTA